MTPGTSPGIFIESGSGRTLDLRTRTFHSKRREVYTSSWQGAGLQMNRHGNVQEPKTKRCNWIKCPEVPLSYPIQWNQNT